MVEAVGDCVGCGCGCCCCGCCGVGACVRAKLETGRPSTPAAASVTVHRVIERFIWALLELFFKPSAVAATFVARGVPR